MSHKEILRNIQTAYVPEGNNNNNGITERHRRDLTFSWNEQNVGETISNSSRQLKTQHFQ